MRRRINRSPESQSVFDGKDGERGDLDGEEDRPPADRQCGHRLQANRRQVDKDHGDDDACKGMARPKIAIGLQKAVDSSP